MITKTVRGSIRRFSGSSRASFLGNLFGSREAKNKEIIENQNDYEVDPSSRIDILNKENSPSYKPFSVVEDMPDFKISQWKSKTVRSQDLEATYSKNDISEAIRSVYTELKGEPIEEDQFSSTNLDDLSFRFNFVKELQKKLGFDISDHILTRSHDLGLVHGFLLKAVASRWSSERNPNAIVLRPEDFKNPNVYLNNELDDNQQQALFEQLKQKAQANE